MFLGVRVIYHSCVCAEFNFKKFWRLQDYSAKIRNCYCFILINVYIDHSSKKDKFASKASYSLSNEFNISPRIVICQGKRIIYIKVAYNFY